MPDDADRANEDVVDEAVQEESEDVDEYDVEREQYHTTYRSGCSGGFLSILENLCWWFNRGAALGLGLGVGYIIAKTVFE